MGDAPSKRHGCRCHPAWGDRPRCIEASRRANTGASEISWEQVLDLFWRGHQPGFESSGFQYRAAIWYADQAQRDVIEASREKIERSEGGPIKTPILPREEFWRAEDYHQKYGLQKHDRVMKNLRETYPEFGSVRLSQKKKDQFPCHDSGQKTTSQ